MRSWLALVVVLALSFTSASAQSDSVIRVGAGPDDPSTPVVYAVQAGLFKKAGLNVELLKLAGGAAISAALAGGSLEIGKGSPIGVIAAHARGLPFTVIGSIAGYRSESPDDAMLVPANSTIKTAKDLAGKTLGAISLQDIGALSTFAWLGQNGLDWKSLKFVEMPATAMLPALEDGRIDAAALPEPILSADLATGKVRTIGYPFDAVSKHFPEAVLFANVNWVNAHPDLVRRFLRAMHDAAAYVGGHEAEVVPMIAQFTGVAPETLTKIRHAARVVAITPGDLQPVIDVMGRYNVIPKTFPAQDLICSCALRQ